MVKLYPITCKTYIEAHSATTDVYVPKFTITTKSYGRLLKIIQYK